MLMGPGNAGGVSLLCKQNIQVGSIPTGSTNYQKRNDIKNPTTSALKDF